MDVEVAYFNKAEANAEKMPFTYQNFTYDNESDGGILNKLTEVEGKIKDIKNDIQNLANDYNTLVRKYEKFSNYESTMKAIIQTMNNNVDTIHRSYVNVLKTASQAVNEHMSTDSTLMSDLDRINGLLAQGNSNN